MRNGEIIVSSVSGLNNKIYEIGDKVNERNFPIGNFEILVRDGFIKETTKEVKAEVKEPKPSSKKK